MIRMLSLVTVVALLAAVPTYAKRVAPKPPVEAPAIIGSVQGVDKDKKTITIASTIPVTKFTAVTEKVVGADGKVVEVVKNVPVTVNEVVTVVYDVTKAKFSDLEGTAIEGKDVFSKIEKGDNIGISQSGKLGDVAPLKEKKVKVVLYPPAPSAPAPK